MAGNPESIGEFSCHLGLTSLLAAFPAGVPGDRESRIVSRSRCQVLTWEEEQPAQTDPTTERAITQPVQRGKRPLRVTAMPV
jgi:hypothetical protein